MFYFTCNHGLTDIGSFRHVETSRARAASLRSLLYRRCQNSRQCCMLLTSRFIISYIIIIMFVYSKLSNATSEEDD